MTRQEISAGKFNGIPAHSLTISGPATQNLFDSLIYIVKDTDQVILSSIFIITYCFIKQGHFLKNIFFKLGFRNNTLLRDRLFIWLQG